MLTESDLFQAHRHRDKDLEFLHGGKVVILFYDTAFLRVLAWTSDHNGRGPGFVVTQFLRSRDPAHDSDIDMGSVRYSTRSGTREVDFTSTTREQELATLEELFERFHKKQPMANRSSPVVRALVRNRMAKYFQQGE